MGFHVVGHAGKPHRQPPNLGGPHHQNDQRRNAYHHHKALDKVGLQGGHVAAQNQHQGRGNGDDHHAGLLVNAQDHRANTGQPLVYRRGVRNQKQEDHNAGKQPHPRALEPFFKQLGHGLDVVAACQVPGPVGQYQPGQQRAENRVAQAHQNAPQTVVPSGTSGIADEHHRGKIGRAVGKRGNPRPCAAAAHGEPGHVGALAGIPNANAQHKQGIYPNDYPNGQFFAHSAHFP